MTDYMKHPFKAAAILLLIFTIFAIGLIFFSKSLIFIIFQEILVGFGMFWLTITIVEFLNLKKHNTINPPYRIGNYDSEEFI